MYPKKLIKKFLGKSSYLPRKIILAIDLLLTALAFSISYWIYFELKGMDILLYSFLAKLLLCVSVNLLFFILFNTYQGIVRYSTLKDSFDIFLALAGANLTLIIFNYFATLFAQHSIFAWEYFFINLFLAFFLTFMLRITVKTGYDYITSSDNKKHNDHNRLLPLIVYGDGTAQVSIAQLIQTSSHLPYCIAGFVSDASGLSGKMILGLPVYNKKHFLEDISLTGKISAVLIDKDALEPSEKQILADKCLEKKIKLLSFPSLEEVMEKGGIRSLNKVSIEDLLGRASIDIDMEAISRDLTEKTVLVTGAAGSIGSEIVRQLSAFSPKQIVLCDIAESPLHQLELEISDNYPNVNIRPLISDVRNRERMRNIFESYRPEYIYHAAAYKHVPMMEKNPSEAVLTNICGTINIADLSLEYGAEKFVMISTDKAVNPGNVMGASKRIAEIYIQSLTGSTRFITTRFGNVLGSTGSVIPRFAEQIKRGGPVTVTHPEVIRYFMTIPEACRLVLEAGTFGKGGEIFVFDMGEPVKIIDLAKKMILLSGYEPYKEIDIEITGLRPGEKLHEELLYHSETDGNTPNRKIKIGKKYSYDPAKINSVLTTLIMEAKAGRDLNAVKTMKTLIPEFVSCNSVYSELD
jgi:FlaA1/EpsC-like NDP-sugar epimerase